MANTPGRLRPPLGSRPGESAADLAVAVAIASSMKDQPVHAGTVLIHEISLSGELRQINQMPSRLNEATKLDFSAPLFQSPSTKAASLDPKTMK